MRSLRRQVTAHPAFGRGARRGARGKDAPSGKAKRRRMTGGREHGTQKKDSMSHTVLNIRFLEYDREMIFLQ